MLRIIRKGEDIPKKVLRLVEKTLNLLAKNRRLAYEQAVKGRIKGSSDKLHSKINANYLKIEELLQR